ncbi:MAG: outer membrane lipoprotein carrier protein LolA [Candidatus Cryptobacteroides sp.]
MRIFKRTIATLAFAALAASRLCAVGPDMESFFAKVSSSLVSFGYSFVCRTSDSRMTGDGEVMLQDDCFLARGNGLEIRCDGQTLWTLDTVAEEAVVETVSSRTDALLANPAMLIVSAGEYFNVSSSGPATFAGQPADKVSLTPKTAPKSSSDISGLTLYFRKGTLLLVGAEAGMKDGTFSTFTLNNFKYSDKLQEKESFRLDEKTLGSSYVVTDLR